MASHGIPRRTLLLLMAVALLPFASPGPVRAAAPLLQDIRVTDSPFSPDGDGIRDKVRLDVTLSRAATVAVSVIDFKDKVVRSMKVRSHDAGTFTWRWNGRDDDERLSPDGPYHFRLDLQAPDGLTETALMGIAKAPQAPYPADPAAVTVVLNPGHGGPDPGAIYGGVDEADLTLDIALRLEQMLEASGVTVVMLRDTDVAVNAAGLDLNGDGAADQSDELLARNDVANLARGDLYVTLMNNAYGCHCVRGTETWTHDERTWSPEALVLASYIQRAHLRRLEAFRHAGWYPIDRGVRFHDFAVVRPYSKKMRRPSLMPSVMTESLFMDHADELRILKRSKVRGELAVAYFEGITKWLNGRAFGLRYEVLDATSGENPRSGPAAYRMRITNTGNRTSVGWQLRASVVPAVPFYDGSPEVGSVLGTVPIEDGLAPGAATSVHLDGLTLPDEAGDWLVKFDVVLPNGDTLGRHGVVGPQLPVRTMGLDSGLPHEQPDGGRRPAAPVGPIAPVAPVEPVLKPLPPDIWLRPAPGWSHPSWRGILAGVVRKLDHDPERHHGHHHGDE